MTCGATLATWLQAIGGLGAFGATAWMAFLTLRYVRAAEKTAAASRAHQVGIAKTLLEDTKRIRLELGPPPAEGGASSLPPAGLVPRVHQWVHRVIPDIAISDATIVGRFMALDEWLDELDATLTRLDSARVLRDEAMRMRDSMYDMYQREAQTRGGSKPEEVGVYLEQSRKAELAEQSVRAALVSADAAYRACHSELTELERLLAPIATR